MTKVYKWNALKAKAVSHFLTRTSCYASLVGGVNSEMAIAAILENNLVDKSECVYQGKNWNELFVELRESVVKVVDGWDVRSAVGLIEKFPDIVRKKDVGRIPIIEMGDDGTWLVVFN